jgi:hypothetical protein
MTVECLRIGLLVVTGLCLLMTAHGALAQSNEPVIPKPAPAPLVASDDASKFPPLLPPLDPARLGTGVQRTMKLLATSTPQHRNKVRILVYGQSISEQDWWKQVAADLRKRFPNADLEMQNRAIGGFASQRLVLSAEADLYPCYPDLTILHVYGANNTYEDIVRKLRSTTTSELLMQTDHATRWPNPHEPETGDKGLWWDHMMNDVFLPGMATKYGCGLCDVRGEWVRYLKDNQLEPKQLTIDGTHLNAEGNNLMAQVISRHLIFRPDLDDSNWKNTVIDPSVNWEKGKVRLEFEGNRIDALADAGGKSGTATIRIDGKKPSEFPECNYAVRPTPGPWSPLFIMKVDHTAPLAVETWTYKVTSVSEDGKVWHFDVSGSVTGPDGGGVSSEIFISHSGRVKIEPGSYFRGFDPATSHLKPMEAGFESKWQVLPLSIDTYNAVPNNDPATEQLTTFAQGLPNGKHVLELTSDGGNLPIKAFRIYNPPYIVPTVHARE